MQNFLDAVNKFMVIDGLVAAGKGALGLLGRKEVASQAEKNILSNSEKGVLRGASTLAKEGSILSNAEKQAVSKEDNLLAQKPSTNGGVKGAHVKGNLPKTEVNTVNINRLRPSQAGNISQYAVKDGETLIKDKQVRPDGFYQVKTPDGKDRFLLRYQDGTGQSNVYEVSHATKLSDGRANIIDPQSGKTVTTLERSADGWRRGGLPGGNPNGSPKPSTSQTQDEPSTEAPPSASTARRPQQPYAAEEPEPQPGTSGMSGTKRRLSTSSDETPAKKPTGDSAPPSPADSEVSSTSSGYLHSPYIDNPPSPNPEMGYINLPQGAHWNDRGYIERNNFPTLYRAEQKIRVDRRGDPTAEGFRNSQFFEGPKKMLSNPTLIASRTKEGAEYFGSKQFGPGNYYLYQIRSQGIPAVSLRENIDHNPAFMEHVNGYQPGAIKDLRNGNQLNTFGNSSYEFDEVHVDNSVISQDRITKINDSTL